MSKQLNKLYRLSSIINLISDKIPQLNSYNINTDKNIMQTKGFSAKYYDDDEDFVCGTIDMMKN